MTKSAAMKAAILHDDRDIRFGEVPDPRLEPGQVLVKSAYAGICGTDLHIFRGEFRQRVKFPAIQGHEFGGTIVEIGKGVTDLKVGDRVAVDPILPCHACVACHSGHINACRTLKLLGVDLAGGFVEDQDRALAQDCAGDVEALALTAGELAAQAVEGRHVKRCRILHSSPVADSAFGAAASPTICCELGKIQTASRSAAMTAIST